MANERARALRKRMTPQEVRVWVQLRALRSQGLHFRRQVPIGLFIVDFACLPARLLVEIDGSQHGMPGQQHRDALRDKSLDERGFAVLRFWNVDVDRSIVAVLDTIVAMATKRLRDDRPDILPQAHSAALRVTAG